jgi:hypothetical protein
MKLRPQFNLRFRSAEQFELVMGEAAREDISMNEYILRGLEGFYVVLKGQRIAAERAEELNGKEKVAEVAAEKAGEIGRENRPAGIQSVGVGGKGGSVRAPKKGFEVGNNAEIATGGSAGVAADSVEARGERGVRKGAAYVNRELLRGDADAKGAAGLAGSVRDAEFQAGGGKFRGSGKCPHGWKDWMTCRNNGGGCE